MKYKLPQEDADMKKEDTLFCNKCGKRILVENGLLKEDCVKITKSWGYFSDKDGRRDTFCLCESCYDEITAAFVLPVSQEEQTEYV
jgi:hypothetical protein